MLKSHDRLSTSVIEFNKEKEERDKGVSRMEKEFGDDEPILGFDEINETLDDAEDRHTALMVASVWNGVHKWLSLIAKDLDKLDDDAIAKKPLNLATPLQGILMNSWREIFITGARAGVAEVNEINLDHSQKSPEGLFNSYGTVRLTNFNNVQSGGDKGFRNSSSSDFLDSNDRLASFAKRDRSGIDKFIKRKPAFEVAYPPDNADLDVLEVDELRDALNLRTQVLADDLSQDVSDRIDRIIKDSIDLHKVEGRKVQGLPKAARSKMVQQINGVIGYERQQQKKKGVPESELARLNIEAPKTGYVIKRARMIASTELNSGYNMGRLQAYKRSNVKYVRWQTIGDSRTCYYCKSRGGTVMPLNEVLTSGLRYSRKKTKRSKYNKFQWFLPAHPLCRCAWQVATDDEIKDKKRAVGAIMSPVALSESWSRIGAAANLISAAGTAGTALSIADRIIKEKRMQEKAKKKARNRAALAAGGALSLGVLSIAMWNWLNRPKNEAANQLASSKAKSNLGIQKAASDLLGEKAFEKSVKGALFKSQGQLILARQKRVIALSKMTLTPALVLAKNKELINVKRTPAQKKSFDAFMESGIDLRNVSDAELVSKHNLSSSDVTAIRKTQTKYEKNMTGTSPYEAVLPGAVFSSPDIADYPWLARVKDVRDLSLNQMIDRGIPQAEAIRIYDNAYKNLRRSAGIAPKDNNEREVLKKLNDVEDAEELEDILQMRSNRKSAARSLFAKIQNLKKDGKKLKSLSEIRTIRNISDQTVAGLLASAEGAIGINELVASGDREFALETLKAKLENVNGVGDKTIEAIYKTLQDTGAQFDDIDDMAEKVERFHGFKINPTARKAMRSLIDFNYLPGLDRQPLNFDPTKYPGIPTGDRRSDV